MCGSSCEKFERDVFDLIGSPVPEEEMEEDTDASPTEEDEPEPEAREDKPQAAG